MTNAAMHRLRVTMPTSGSFTTRLLLSWSMLLLLLLLVALLPNQSTAELILSGRYNPSTDVSSW